MAQIRLIRPPDSKDLTLFLRTLFLRTERQIIDEITRKRAAGYVDYAEVAALERIQKILQSMVDESWSYVPQMIEKIFYRSDKHAAGYTNARTLTAPQIAVVQQLSNNLLGEIMEASETAYQTAQEFYTVARLEADPYRKAALLQTAGQEVSGIGWKQTSAKMAAELKNQGITGFVDKAGRKWTLSNYCNMATRTTARQAEVAAVLTADEHDLWQIVKIGSTCPVCAPLEGRVYSKSGANPDYPPLSLAFGKVDPDGGDDLTNTYLNIHPNCLHSLIRYTTAGKTEKQIQWDKDFSDPKKNPLSRDPRTKKQIAAYQEKERNRQRLLRDMKQHKEYRAVLGSDVPKDFEKFKLMKYNKPEKFRFVQLDYQRRKKLIDYPERRLPNAEKAILPEGKFTKYLLGGNNEKGLAKGKAITSRLGYTLDSWKDFRQEIASGVLKYPAIGKGKTEFGERYEQKMILYGKKGTPANVVVGWLVKPDGTVSMTSAYIKEVE